MKTEKFDPVKYTIDIALAQKCFEYPDSPEYYDDDTLVHILNAVELALTSRVVSFEAFLLHKQSAWLLFDLGENLDAEFLYEQALVIADEISVAPEQIGLVLGELGKIKSQLGKGAEAKDLIEEAIQIFKPAELVGTMRCWNYFELLGALGSALSALGEFDEAETVLFEAIETSQQIEFDTPMDYSNFWNDLATIQLKRGKLAEAKTNLTKAYAERKSRAGNQRSGLRTILLNLSNLSLQLGENEEGIKYAIEALEIVRETHDDTSIQLADAYDALGMAYCQVGKFKNATANVSRGLEIKISVLPAINQSLARSYNNLGYVYLLESNLKEAKTNFKNAVSALGTQSNDPLMGVALSNLGCVCSGLEELEVAIDYFQQASDFLNDFYDGQHIQCANALAHLGSVCVAAGELDRGIENTLRAKEIAEKSVGNSHPDYARVLFKLAFGLRLTGKLDSAAENAVESLSILKTFLGPLHHDYAVVSLEYATILLESKKHNEAKRIAENNLDIICNVLGKNSKEFIKGLATLARANLECGYRELGISQFEETCLLAENFFGIEHQTTRDLKKLLDESARY